MPQGRYISTGGVGWGLINRRAYSLNRILKSFHAATATADGHTRRIVSRCLSRDEIRQLRKQLRHALGRYRRAQADDATGTQWGKAEEKLRRRADSLLKRGGSTKRIRRLADAVAELSITQHQSLYSALSADEVKLLFRIKVEDDVNLPHSLLGQLAKIDLPRTQFASGNPSQVMLIQECVPIWERVTGASAGARTDRSGKYNPDRNYSPMEDWLNDTSQFVGGDPFTPDRVIKAISDFKKSKNYST